MEHAGDPALLHCGPEDFSGIRLGLASVDDERQPRLARRVDVRFEPLALRLAVGLVVIIIEAALADGDDTRMIGCLGQCCGAEVRMRVGLVRVDPDAGPHVGVAFGDRDDVAPLLLPRGDVEETRDAATARIVEHFILSFDEAFVVQMAMAIDQLHCAGSGSSSSSSRGNKGVGWANTKPLFAKRLYHSTSTRAP